MQQALIAPTEAGYDLAEIKRATLIYDKVFILESGDRDLFPRNAMGIAMGMPPVVSMPGGPIRPMGKIPDYDVAFDQMVNACKPLLDAGALEVTRTYNREETDAGSFTIGGVPLGGYELNVAVVLAYYRALARSDEFLLGALDQLAIQLASGQDSQAYAEQGAADGGINDDPALPEFGGSLQNGELRPVLTTIARSRIGMALKTWGVAQQRGIVPVLPAPSARVLDCLTRGIRTAIDATDPDPYWARRTVILDVVMGELFSDDRLSDLSPSDLLQFRTPAMARAAEARSKLFSELREMAGEQTNLSLPLFREKVEERLASYRKAVAELNEQRRRLGWTLTLEIAKTGVGGVAAATAAGGLFHAALPVSLSAGLFAAASWALGKVQDNVSDFRDLMAAERDLKGSDEFAVFRRFNYLIGEAGSKS